VRARPRRCQCAPLIHPSRGVDGVRGIVVSAPWAEDGEHGQARCPAQPVMMRAPGCAQAQLQTRRRSHVCRVGPNCPSSWLAPRMCADNPRRRAGRGTRRGCPSRALRAPGVHRKSPAARITRTRVRAPTRYAGSRSGRYPPRTRPIANESRYPASAGGVLDHLWRGAGRRRARHAFASFCVSGRGRAHPGARPGAHHRTRTRRYPWRVFVRARPTSPVAAVHKNAPRTRVRGTLVTMPLPPDTIDGVKGGRSHHNTIGRTDNPRTRGGSQAMCGAAGGPAGRTSPVPERTRSPFLIARTRVRVTASHDAGHPVRPCPSSDSVSAWTDVPPMVSDLATASRLPPTRSATSSTILPCVVEARRRAHPGARGTGFGAARPSAIGRRAHPAQLNTRGTQCVCPVRDTSRLVARTRVRACHRPSPWHSAFDEV